jgi:ribonuclease P protein component
MRANGLEHSRAGLVVSKKVGGAVIRNRVKRRLRHLLASELGQANHVDVVVRAFPGADRADLQPQLASALRACYRKLQA